MMKIANLLYSFYLLSISFFQQEEGISNPEIVGDILEPDPLPFTFETIGWKVLAVVVIVIAVIVFYKWLKLYRKNKYRRESVKKMQLIKNENAQSQYKINQLNIILKQVAIVTFGRTEVAELYGDKWYAFLDSKYKKSEFANYSSNFNDAIYKNKEVDESTLQSIYKITKTWINEHS